MRSRPVIAFAVVVVLGLAAFLVVGASRRDAVAQTLGNGPVGPIAWLKQGQELCQQPIGLSDDVERVEFNPGAVAKRTPAIDVTLRTYRGNDVLGRGVVPAGFDPAKPQTVSVGHVAAGRLVKLCFRNRGPARVAIFGDVLWGVLCTPTGGRQASPACTPAALHPTISTSDAIFKGKPVRGDVAAIFLHDRSSSLLSRVPKMIDRASLFRPGFVSPGLWIALIVLCLIGAPAALAFALARSARSDDQGDGDPPALGALPAGGD